MEAAAGGGSGMFGVEARGTADRHDIHRTVIEEALQVVVGGGAVLGGNRPCLVAVRAPHRRHLATRGGCRARVRRTDVAPAEDANLHLGHTRTRQERTEAGQTLA